MGAIATKIKNLGPRRFIRSLPPNGRTLETNQVIVYDGFIDSALFLSDATQNAELSSDENAGLIEIWYDMGDRPLKALADPTDDQDVATKGYADANVDAALITAAADATTKANAAQAAAIATASSDATTKANAAQAAAIAAAASDATTKANAVLASSLQKSQNLTDLPSASDARDALGLGTAAVAGFEEFVLVDDLGDGVEAALQVNVGQPESLVKLTSVDGYYPGHGGQNIFDLQPDNIVAIRKVSAHITSPQNINIDDDFVVSFGATNYDYAPSNLWSGGAPTRITIPSGGGGLYHVIATCTWAAGANPDTRRNLSIYKNGSFENMSQDYPAVSSLLTHQVSDVLVLLAGDYLELWVGQDDSNPLALEGANMKVTRIGT